VNLRDAVRRTIEYTSPEGKHYSLKPQVATLIVRPRGWHLVEKHMTVDGSPVAGALFDFGLYFFHNARELIARGRGPRKREDVHVTAANLVEVPQGTITEAGLRTNVSVGIQYIEAWLRGSGAVPIFNLMEDAATAEISRAQVWQWIRHPKGVLEDGRKVTIELFHDIMREELQKVRDAVGADRYAAGKFEDAARLFDKLTTTDEFVDFLMFPGYELLP
jgi:malate synthase